MRIAYMELWWLGLAPVIAVVLFVYASWRRNQITKVLDLVGFDSPTTKFPNELSGGEQQRIAIARSMLNDPELIIADEPTGNLDPETSMEIISLFKKLNSMGTSMIIATHDYNLILKLDGEVYKCEDGSIFEVKRN